MWIRYFKVRQLGTGCDVGEMKATVPTAPLSWSYSGSLHWTQLDEMRTRCEELMDLTIHPTAMQTFPEDVQSGPLIWFDLISSGSTLNIQPWLSPRLCYPHRVACGLSGGSRTWGLCL